MKSLRADVSLMKEAGAHPASDSSKELVEEKLELRRGRSMLTLFSVASGHKGMDLRHFLESQIMILLAAYSISKTSTTGVLRPMFKGVNRSCSSSYSLFLQKFMEIFCQHSHSVFVRHVVFFSRPTDRTSQIFESDSSHGVETRSL